MKYFKKCISAALILLFLIPVKLLASGYSVNKNHKIWQLRLAAGRYAAQEAQKKCAWAPESPPTFSDQLPSNQNISNEQLYLDIMTMLRLDQNARAISDALRDNKGMAHIKVQEVDNENLPGLKDIFSKYGFPTIEEVGDSGVNAMLMLVAHADEDLEFQKSVALKMDDEVAKGELPAIYPTILKTIRPQIIGKSRNLRNGVSDTDQKTYSSPRDCYNHKYNNFIDSYVRSGYKNLING